MDRGPAVATHARAAVSRKLEHARRTGCCVGEVRVEEAPAVLHFVVGGEVVPAKAEVEGELVVDLPVVAEVGGSDPVAAAEFADGLKQDGWRSTNRTEHVAGEGNTGGRAQSIGIRGVLRGGVGVERQLDEPGGAYGGGYVGLLPLVGKAHGHGVLALGPLEVVECGVGFGDDGLGGACVALLRPSGECGRDCAGLAEGAAGEVGAGRAGGDVGDAHGRGRILRYSVGGCLLRLDEAGVGELGLAHDAVADDPVPLGVIELGEDVGDRAGDVGERQIAIGA